jgi:glycosyltransferase 2 family protein
MAVHETARKWRSFVHNRWVRAAAIALSVVIAAGSLERMPRASLWPALIGLVPWIVGKYLLCPLRWRGISESDHPRSWYLRVYAESELLGLVTPGHAGADLWRMHRLQRTGRPRSGAVAEVGLDRLLGAIGLTTFVLIAGAALPPQVVQVGLVAIAVGVLAVLALRRWRPHLLPRFRLPSFRRLTRGVLLSMGYQLSILAMLVGTVAAVGQSVSPLALMGVFGASQVAGIIPGVHGASPRDGALALGIASLGVPLGAALGAVALTTLLAWLPALLFGGTSLFISRLRDRRRVARATRAAGRHPAAVAA